MQSYVYYSIIIDCAYYDVGNETTTEIVVERIRRKRRYCYIEFDEFATRCLSERKRATLVNEQRRRSDCIIIIVYDDDTVYG